MHNFELIQQNIDTNHFLKELYIAQKKNMISQDYGFTRRKKHKENKLDYQHESGWEWLITGFYIRTTEEEYFFEENSPLLYKTKLYTYFPTTLRYLQIFADEQNAYLQRVIIATLLPDGTVLPHTDIGEYYNKRNRYHLILQSERGSEFIVVDEKQIFKEGELWWFDNKKMHSVKNLHNSNRIHIIFDLLPKHHYSLREKMTHRVLNTFLQITYNSLGYTEFNNLLDKIQKLRNFIINLK